MREVFEWVEIDLPLCSRVYGSAPCAAVLGSTGVRKCYNTKATCQDRANYADGTPLTIRLCREGSSLPRDGLVYFPVLKSVSQSSSTANVAGTDPAMGQLGRQSTLSFSFADHPYHERGIDPYQSQRVSGAAQTDEGGYLPESRGTLWPKIKARWPNYSRAPTRLKRGVIEGGVVSDVTTYHYLLTDLSGPSKGVMKAEGRGVIDLMNAKRSLCPKPSNGVLALAMDAVQTSLTLTPSGVGSEYPANGYACIGSEVVYFIRSGDTLSIARAQYGTTAAAHSAGDSVQLCKVFINARLDEAAADLVVNFTDTPASYVPGSEWAYEVTIWAASIRLNTIITTPTAVGTLLGELSDLGCTIVEDERAQKLRLKMNRPFDDTTDTLRTVTDRTAFDIGDKDDRDDERITQVLFYHKRRDPTKSLTDSANYDRAFLTVNPDAIDLYDGSATRTIYTRWLDQGDDATVQIASWRLLRRLEKSPIRISVTLDHREKAINILDVVDVETVDLSDETGKAVKQRMQVIGRSEPKPYVNVKAILQRLDFNGRYGRIAPNSVSGNYSTATDAQRARYAFIVGATLKFPDNTGPYRII